MKKVGFILVVSGCTTKKDVEYTMTTNDNKHIADPELYERLAKPVDNVETASNVGKEFYEELCKLREKYNVPEMVVAFGINAKTEDKDMFVIQVGYRGGVRTERLILELLGQTHLGKAVINLVDEVSLAVLS